MYKRLGVRFQDIVIQRRDHTQDGENVNDGVPYHYNNFNGLEIGEVFDVGTVVVCFWLVY